MNEWMTDTVRILMDGIDAERAYDRLPILADALQDGGYGATEEEAKVLVLFRAQDELAAEPWYRRLVEGAVTVERAKEARDWLAEHAKNFWKGGYDYNDDGEEVGEHQDFRWLIRVCDRYLDTGDDTHLSYDTPDEAWEKREEMWRHYNALTGRGSEKDYDITPFRCSC